MNGIKLYWSFVRPEKLKFFSLVLMSLTSGLLEALGLVSMIPALTEISKANVQSVYLLFLPLAVLLLGTLSKFFAEWFQARLVSGIEFGLRRELINHVFYSPWARVRKLNQGSITTGVISEASQVANGVIALSNAVSTSAVVIVFWGAAFIIEPFLALVISIFLLGIGLLVRVQLRKFRSIEKRLRFGYEQVSERVSNLLLEIKFVRLSSQRGFWKEQIETHANELSSARRGQLTLPASNRAILESAAAIFLVASLGTMALAGLPLAKGIVFLGIFYRLVPRAQSLQGYISVSFAQLEWLRSWDKRKKDLGAFEPQSQEIKQQNTEMPTQSGLSLLVRDLVWEQTPKGSEVALNFELAPGEFVAILGKTGVGKTTLLDTLLGLHEFESGSVKIGGVDIEGTKENKVFSQISVVTQDVPLFNGSIRSNVISAYEYDSDWFKEVIQVAQLGDFLNNLSEGESTAISNKGLSISGGERQRIGVARAIYSKPALLVMDEATNGLDEETEEALILALRRLTWGPSIIAVTHKSTMLRLSDRVLRLSGGLLLPVSGFGHGETIEPD